MLRGQHYCLLHPAGRHAGNAQRMLGEGCWDEANEKVGDTATACGPSRSIVSAEGATFFNLDKAYPDSRRLTMVIWEQSTASSWEKGEEVCGRGLVSAYEGALQIEFDSIENFYWSTEEHHVPTIYQP